MVLDNTLFQDFRVDDSQALIDILNEHTFEWGYGDVVKLYSDVVDAVVEEYGMDDYLALLVSTVSEIGNEIQRKLEAMRVRPYTIILSHISIVTTMRVKWLPIYNPVVVLTLCY